MWVHDTRPLNDGTTGTGMAFHSLDVQPSIASVGRSLVSHAHSAGIHVVGSVLDVAHTVVRDTQVGLWAGRGIEISEDLATLAPSVVTLTRTSVLDNAESGVVLFASQAEMSALRVANDVGSPAQGLVAQQSIENGQHAELTLRDSHVDDSWRFGVVVLGSDATISGTRVVRTRTDGAEFGDGVSVVSGYSTPSTAALERVHVAENDRAGLSVFGAHADIAGSNFMCNGFDLAGVDDGGQAFELVDRGMNMCGCDTNDVCRVAAVALTPPTPVER